MKLKMFDIEDYPFEIHRFSKENGGGFLISYPDFSECIADGETVTEAISNGREALLATIKTLEANGFSVPEPSFA
jgi:antitoxin HicB